MKHQKYLEMMELALLKELNDAELKELHKHLIDCDDCQYEYDRLNNFYKSIEKLERKEIDEFSLQNARRDLRLALDKEISNRSFFVKMIDSLRNFTFYYSKPIMVGTSSLAVGLFVGYVMFHSTGKDNFINTSLVDQNATKITNVRFEQPAGINGDVQFTYDAIQPVTMKGNINDPEIQMVLAQALLNEKNPGSRYRTVSEIANQTAENKSVIDPKIKTALITKQ